MAVKVSAKVHEAQDGPAFGGELRKKAEKMGQNAFT